MLPKDINTFVDLFAGGFNVGANVNAKRIVCNDIIPYLIEILCILKANTKEDTFAYIDRRIRQYGLSATNGEGYALFRDEYNRTHNPLDLYVLVAHSFNYQLRFNSRHEYNNPFGKSNSTFNSTMRSNLSAFIDRLHSLDIEFVCGDFGNYPFDSLDTSDFVYCDPPYLITTGSYNDGKRGFKGWGETQEKELLDLLSLLNARGVRFALSNVLRHKGRTNDILASWANHGAYRVEHLKKNYAASSYHTLDRDKNGSDEVLIMNYPPCDI